MPVLILGPLATATTLTAQDPTADEKAKQRFESLLTAAKKQPEKADWKALRHAFAETTDYQPYNPAWRSALTKVMGQLDSGDAKEAEAALIKLLDREGYMRLDAHSLAVLLYKKTGEKEKEEMHRQFIEGISSTLFVPGAGQSFEKPIEVLFIEEEYLLLGALKVKAKRQGLQEHDGHRFDVYNTEPKEGEAPRTFYFNVDLLQNALARMLRAAKEAPPEKP
jgi:hypothetical protein